MLDRADVMGRIQQLYMQDRPIPYLTFIHVFNGLLEDPVAVVPREPCDVLRERFRAVCMCVNVGILDTQGRQDQRVKEFREVVYPAWQQAIPPDEFATYDSILQGRLRKGRDPEEHERAVALEAASERSKALLAKLRLIDGPPPPAPKPEAPVAPAVEATAVGMPAVSSAESPSAAGPTGREEAQRAKADTWELRVGQSPEAPYAGIDDLCHAIRAGALDASYVPREQASDLAHYALEGTSVSVKLAEADGKEYTVLTARIGRSSVPEARETIDVIAAGMGYRRMADYAYMREDESFVCTLTVGPNSTNLACAAAEEGARGEVVRRIQLLHRDLGELMECTQS